MIIKIKISEPKTLSESKGRKAPPFNRNKQRNEETNNTEEYLQPKPTVNHRKTQKIKYHIVSFITVSVKLSHLLVAFRFFLW